MKNNTINKVINNNKLIYVLINIYNSNDNNSNNNYDTNDDNNRYC